MATTTTSGDNNNNNNRSWRGNNDIGDTTMANKVATIALIETVQKQAREISALKLRLEVLETKKKLGLQ